MAEPSTWDHQDCDCDSCRKKHSRLSKIYDDEALGSSFLIFKNTVSIGLSPLPVTVTTRIITFLVGDPNLNLHLPQESCEGNNPKYQELFSTHLNSAKRQCQSWEIDASSLRSAERRLHTFANKTTTLILGLWGQSATKLVYKLCLGLEYT